VKPASAAPPVRKKPRSRWKNASSTSRWNAHAAASPGRPPPRSAARLEVARLAQHLAEQLVAPRTVGTCEDLMQLADRDVLALKKAGAKVSPATESFAQQISLVLPLSIVIRIAHIALSHVHMICIVMKQTHQ
jgi:hypothetical protein